MRELQAVNSQQLPKNKGLVSISVESSNLQQTCKRRRLDPESSSSERADDSPTVAFEPTDYLGVERSSVRLQASASLMASPSQATGLYRTRIKRARGQPQVFGWYATCTEAAVAYDELAVRVLGPNANTNFEQAANAFPLYAAPLPVSWKSEDNTLKPRRKTWYESLITNCLVEQGVLERATETKPRDGRRLRLDPPNTMKASSRRGRHSASGGVLVDTARDERSSSANLVDE